MSVSCVKGQLRRVDLDLIAVHECFSESNRWLIRSSFQSIQYRTRFCFNIFFSMINKLNVDRNLCDTSRGCLRKICLRKIRGLYCPGSSFSCGLPSDKQ